MNPHRRTPKLLVAILCSCFGALPAYAQPGGPPPDAPPPDEPLEAPVGEALESEPAPAPEAIAPPPSVAAPPAPVAPPPPPPAAPPPSPLAVALGPVTLIPSAQLWTRGEVRINDYLSGGEDLHFAIQRARAGLSASIGYATAFLQMQDVRVYGQVPPGSDGALFGLHQGYIDLHNSTGYIRLGRQEVNYGTQRMIGALDWTAAARSFDGLRLHGTFGKVVLDAFGAYLSPRTTVPTGRLPPPTMPAGPFPGQYLATGSVGLNLATQFNTELYYLSRHDEANETHVYSPGLRVWGAPGGGLTYDAEAYIQFGERGVSDGMGGLNVVDHFAYAAAGDVFWRSTGSLGLGLDAGAALGSGPTPDGDVDQFENFYPTNHKFYGYMDLFGLRNVVDGHVGASLAPAGTNFQVALRGFLFANQRGRGAWTNAPGGVIGAAGTNTTGSRFLGFEGDLFAVYKPTNYLTLQGGYSLFAPGEGAEGFGHDDVQHWAWLWLAVHTP